MRTMSSPTSAPPRPSSTFTSLVAVGVLVVAAGLLLPRLLSLSPTPQTADADRLPPSAAAPAVLPVSAPPSTVQPAEPTGESASLGWVMAKLMFGLAIVAGVCIGVARWSNRTRQTAPTGILSPLAKLAVDPRCVVHLVAAGGRRLLIGVDAAGVKAVLELPPK
jgi:flagellar protein FliO/FliZ